VGVDRLSCSFPVAEYDEDPTAWDSVALKAPGTPHQRLTLSRTVDVVDGCKAFVGVQEVPDNPSERWWGKVELNPSRVVDPGGHGLASVGDLPDVMLATLRGAGAVVTPAAALDEMNVKRVDVARDFTEVDDATPMLRALGSVHRPYSRLNLLHADSQRNGAQTLMVGARSAGLVRLYDQHAAYGSPVGSLRFEAECRDWSARLADVRKFSDLSQESVTALAVDRWEWSAFGVEVASSLATLLREVVAAGVVGRLATGFVSWLVEQSAGVEVCERSKATLAKYRRLQRQLRLAAPSDMHSSLSVVRWLDLDEGTVMRRVA
jgi:hypothetical protein